MVNGTSITRRLTVWNNGMGVFLPYFYFNDRNFTLLNIKQCLFFFSHKKETMKINRRNLTMSNIYCLHIIKNLPAFRNEFRSKPISVIFVYRQTDVCALPTTHLAHHAPWWLISSKMYTFTCALLQNVDS